MDERLTKEIRIDWQEWGAISSQQGRRKEAVSLLLTLAKSSYLEQASHGADGEG